MVSKKKIIISIMSVGIIILTLFISFYLMWNASSNHDKKIIASEYVDNHLKKIILINEHEQKVDVTINFEYSRSEITNQKIPITDYYNISSFYIEPGKEYSVILPIPFNEDISFPKSFSLIVKGSLKNLINDYNEKEFFKNTTPVRIINQNKENSWKLKLNK